MSEFFFFFTHEKEVFFFVTPTHPPTHLPSRFSFFLLLHFSPLLCISTSSFKCLVSFATAGYLLVTPLTLLPNPFYYFSRGFTVRRYLASTPAT